MQLEKLTIGLRQPYAKPGPDNPYQAVLSVGYDNNRMQVELPSETCARLLELVADDVAAAAQVQISDFVRNALSVSRQQQIEGTVEAS